MKLSKTQLERLHDEAYFVIRASEDWAESYHQAPKQWKAIIILEHSMARDLRRHFKELAKQRIAQWVNWSEYQNRTVKATDITVTIDENDGEFQAEESLILGVMVDSVKDGMLQGSLAGREIYTRWLDTALVNDYIAQQAVEHAADLAKGLTQTTLNAVQSSIQKSIQLGENIEQATRRLQRIISDPQRAELIARTETVRAFQAGKHEYANRTGAVKKQWIALPGADDGSDLQPCLDNSSQDPIGMDEDFDSGDPFPPAHPRCRCDVIYIYPDKINGQPVDSGDAEDL